jgi:hypothetical protein
VPTSLFQQADMLTFAVSKTRMAAIDFGGYIPEAQSIRVPSSQNDIHTFLESALLEIT